MSEPAVYVDAIPADIYRTLMSVVSVAGPLVGFVICVVTLWMVLLGPWRRNYSANGPAVATAALLVGTLVLGATTLVPRLLSTMPDGQETATASSTAPADSVVLAAGGIAALTATGAVVALLVGDQ